MTKTSILSAIVVGSVFATIFIIVGGFSGFSLSAFNPANYNLEPGAYYGVDISLLQLEGSSNGYHQATSSNYLDLDGSVISNPLALAPDVQFDQSAVYYSDFMGNYIGYNFEDLEEPVEEITMIMSDTEAMSWQRYFVTVEYTLRTKADMKVSEAFRNVWYVRDQLGIGWAKFAVPNHVLTYESAPVDTTLRLKFACTPPVFGASTVEGPDGEIVYSYNDSWMGVLGARMVQYTGGEVLLEDPRTGIIYNNRAGNIRSNPSSTTYDRNTGEGFNLLGTPGSVDISYSARDTPIESGTQGYFDVEPLRPEFNDPYRVSGTPTGAQLSIHSLDMGMGIYDIREFDADLALTNAPDTGYVEVQSTLQAGMQAYRDWITYSQYDRTVVFWLFDDKKTGTYTIDYLTGGRVRDCYVNGKIVLDIVSVTSFNYTGLMAPYIGLEIPKDFSPEMQAVGTGQVIDYDPLHQITDAVAFLTQAAFTFLPLILGIIIWVVIAIVIIAVLYVVIRFGGIAYLSHRSPKSSNNPRKQGYYTSKSNTPT